MYKMHRGKTIIIFYLALIGSVKFCHSWPSEIHSSNGGSEKLRTIPVIPVQLAYGINVVEGSPLGSLLRNIRLMKNRRYQKKDVHIDQGQSKRREDFSIESNDPEILREKIKTLQTILETLEGSSCVQEPEQSPLSGTPFKFALEDPTKVNEIKAKIMDDFEIINLLKTSYDSELRKIITDFFAAKSNKRVRKNKLLTFPINGRRFGHGRSRFSFNGEGPPPMKFQGKHNLLNLTNAEQPHAPETTGISNLWFYALVFLVMLSLLMLVMNIFEIKKLFLKRYQDTKSKPNMDRETKEAYVCELEQDPEVKVSSLYDVLHKFQSYGSRINLMTLPSTESVKTKLTPLRSGYTINSIINASKSFSNSKTNLRKRRISVGGSGMGKRNSSKSTDSERRKALNKIRISTRNRPKKRCRMNELGIHFMQEFDQPYLESSLTNYTTMKKIDACNMLPLKKLSHLDLSTNPTPCLKNLGQKSVFTKQKNTMSDTKNLKMSEDKLNSCCIDMPYTKARESDIYINGSNSPSDSHYGMFHGRRSIKWNVLTNEILKKVKNLRSKENVEEKPSAFKEESQHNIENNENKSAERMRHFCDAQKSVPKEEGSESACPCTSRSQYSIDDSVKNPTAHQGSSTSAFFLHDRSALKSSARMGYTICNTVHIDNSYNLGNPSDTSIDTSQEFQLAYLTYSNLSVADSLKEKSTCKNNP